MSVTGGVEYPDLAGEEHTMDGMAQHRRTPGTRGRPWPLMLIAAPAAVAIWSGWVGLGSKCGFGLVQPLPGITRWHMNTAITLPVGIESYGAYALYVWLGGLGNETARTFARRSAIGALVLGCLGQVAFHLLAAAGVAEAPWPVVMMVACLPVVTLFFAAALVHLMRADTAALAADAPDATEGTAGRATAKATPEAAPEATDKAIGEPPAEPPAEPLTEPLTEPRAVPSESHAAEPPRKPPAEPRQRTVRIDKSPEAERARATYRKSVRQGDPMSDRALGEMFGKSRTWGASRIKETEAGPHLATRTG